MWFCVGGVAGKSPCFKEININMINSVFHAIKMFVCDPRERFKRLNQYGYYKHIEDIGFLKIAYKRIMGIELDLNNPKTFNEKIQWLKLYDRKPEYTTMVDKYEVKKYVASIIGDEYIIPTLGVWDKFEDIDFERLPDQFVLKCTHDSGGIVICQNKAKLSYKKAKEKINKCLKRNYYWYMREWPYKNVKPRILAEKYMCDESEGELQDYKLMCFAGKVKCTFVCSDRFSDSGLKVTFYDNNWEMMPFERHYPRSNKPIAKPKCYDKMVELAEKLSKSIPFVRVDFYEIQGKLYFGELTFFPGSGLEEFTPSSWDKVLGDWIQI